MTFRVELMPWRGYDNPSLPAGVWLAGGQVTGDATGGFNSAQFLFNLANEEASARQWNLEQFQVRNGGTAIGDIEEGQMRINNMGQFTIDRALFLRTYHFRLPVGQFDSSTPVNVMSQPIFLGSLNLPGGTANIEFAIPNTNGGSISAVAWGYMWEPRSLMAEGGLQRPVGSLFGW